MLTADARPNSENPDPDRTEFYHGDSDVEDARKMTCWGSAETNKIRGIFVHDLLISLWPSQMDIAYNELTLNSSYTLVRLW